MYCLLGRAAAVTLCTESRIVCMPNLPNGNRSWLVQPLRTLCVQAWQHRGRENDGLVRGEQAPARAAAHQGGSRVTPSTMAPPRGALYVFASFLQVSRNRLHARRTGGGRELRQRLATDSAVVVVVGHRSRLRRAAPGNARCQAGCQISEISEGRRLQKVPHAARTGRGHRAAHR